MRELARGAICRAKVQTELREGTPNGHAFEADSPGDAAVKIVNFFRSEPSLTAAKAWHPTKP
jgi:hypothetical protein